MKTIKSTNTIVGMSLGGVVCVAVLAIVLASCQNPATPISDADGDVSPQAPQAQAYTGQTRGGAELWTQNCQHCHNTRSPASYSDEEWDVAMMHMRNQARLTAQEHRTIREFLKAGN